LAESVIGLFKTELIKPRGPRQTVEEVEVNTLRYVYPPRVRDLLHQGSGLGTATTPGHGRGANLSTPTRRHCVPSTETSTPASPTYDCPRRAADSLNNCQSPSDHGSLATRDR
jgi:hypothetical protein